MHFDQFERDFAVVCHVVHAADRQIDRLVTEWEQFRALDFDRLKGVMANALLVDLRNIYRADEVVRYGFAYEGAAGLR